MEDRDLAGFLPSDLVILHFENKQIILKIETDIDMTRGFPVLNAVFDGIFDEGLYPQIDQDFVLSAGPYSELAQQKLTFLPLYYAIGLTMPH